MGLTHKNIEDVIGLQTCVSSALQCQLCRPSHPIPVPSSLV